MRLGTQAASVGFSLWLVACGLWLVASPIHFFTKHPTRPC
jgi:hypothetical protein